MKENRIELLSPAGNIDSFKAAINAGTDAIYMGVNRFNARTMAKNFDLESYKECIKYAHILNVKVYLTLNTLVYDQEIKEALELVINLYSVGLDAVIVQDIGLASLIHKVVPKLPLHASTQMSVYNIEQVKYLEKLGFKRVVLARELSIKEIEYICKNTSLEIEVFVHGALCVSYSGQCLLSEVIGGRSANRGTCAQPCRMKYTLCSKNTKANMIVKNRYILSKKDIFGVSYIYKLYKIGVKSLKIEGRNKTPEYVAGVTKTYRKYLDNIAKEKNDVEVNKEDKNYLLQIFNRDGKSNGYFEGVRYKDSITENSPKNIGIYLGEVLLQKKEYIKIKLENDIHLHDGIEILDDNNIIFSNIITCIKDESKKVINRKVEKGNMVWLGDVKNKIPIGTKVYKTSDSGINNELKKYYDGTYKKRRKVDISIKIKAGEKITVTTNNLAKNIFVSIDALPENANNKPTTCENVKEAFLKTLDTLFEFNIIDIRMDHNLFVAKSKLNELRRTFVSRLEDAFNKSVEVKGNLQLLEDIDKGIVFPDKLDNINKNILHIYRFKKGFDYIKYYEDTYNKELEIVYIDIYDMYINKNNIFETFKNKVDIYVILPNIGGKKTDEYIFKNIENLINNGIKGIIVGNIGYIEKVLELKRKYNIILIADYSLNIVNKFSASFYNTIGFDIICPSVELTEEQVNNLKDFNVEVVSDYQTVMTSRYCILGSYIENRKDSGKCSMPCIKNRYYLLDSYDKRYDIVCSNIDCIMKIIAKRNRFKNTNFRTRRVIL